METGFGLKEASGELCVGPLGRYVGAGGGALALSGGGAPRSDSRKREVEGGKEVPPPPRAPLREVMWGQTENTRQGPEKAGSGWTRRARRQSGVGTAGGAGEAEARAGRRARARGAGPPAGQRDGAGSPRVWPWGRVLGLQLLSSLWEAEPTGEASLLLPGPQHKLYDDNRGGRGSAWTRCRLGGVPGWDGAEVTSRRIQVLGAAWRWRGGRKETSQAGEEAPARPL